MTNLTPETRVNKLGVPVIKHVRASPKTKSSQAKLPAPSTKPKAKATKYRSIQVERTISSFEHMPDNRLNERTPGNFAFTANDVEVYSVLGITDAGNAFALLELGARSAEDAQELLTEMGAEDLLIDRKEFMQEMLDRNISPEVTASCLPMIPEEWEDSPHLADAVEFSSLDMFEGVQGVSAVRRFILAGDIRFSDVDALGSKLSQSDNLRTMTDTLLKLGNGSSRNTIEDVKAFLNRAVKDRVVRDGLRNGTFLLEKHGVEAIDKLEDLGSFTVRFKSSPNVDHDESVDSAYYEALLSEAIVREGKEQHGRYWVQTFPSEVSLLRAEGISVEDAAPLMVSGLTAHQTAGVLKGVEMSVSDGWL